MMKQKHLLSLLQSGYTTIQVYFPEAHAVPAAPRAPQSANVRPAPWETHYNSTAPAYPPGAPQQPTEQRALYTYKARGKVAVGDRVVVEHRGQAGLAIAVVHSVDPAPRIDVDADHDYKWIVQRVNLEAYSKILDAEQAFADQLQEVERQHQRDELIAKMTTHLPEGSNARNLFDAAIANFATAFALQAPTAAVSGYAATQAPETTPVQNLGTDADCLAAAEQARDAGFVGMACK